MCREERTTVCACTLCPCTGATYLYLCGSWASPDHPCLNRRVYTFTPPLTLTCPTCISGQHNRHPAWMQPTTGVRVPFWRAYDPVIVFWNGFDTDEQIRNYVFQRDGLPESLMRTYMGDLGYGDLDLVEPNLVPTIGADIIFALKPDMVAPPLSQIFESGWKAPNGTNVGTTVKTGCDGLLVPQWLMNKSETVRMESVPPNMSQSQTASADIASSSRHNGPTPLPFDPRLPTAVQAAGGRYRAAAGNGGAVLEPNRYLSGEQSPTAALASQTQSLTLQARQRANSGLTQMQQYASTMASAGPAGPTSLLAHPRVRHLRVDPNRRAGRPPPRGGSFSRTLTITQGQTARKNESSLEDESSPTSPSTRSLRPRKAKPYTEVISDVDSSSGDEDESNDPTKESESEDEDAEDAGDDEADEKGEDEDAEGEDEEMTQDVEGEDEEMDVDEPAKAQEHLQKLQRVIEPPLKRRKVEAPVIHRPRTRAQTTSATVIDLTGPEPVAPSKGKAVSRRQRALTGATKPTRSSARLRKR